MLADGLTEDSPKACSLSRGFVSIHEWKIVFDGNFLSARKGQVASRELMENTIYDNRRTPCDELEYRRQALQDKNMQLSDSTCEAVRVLFKPEHY